MDEHKNYFEVQNETKYDHNGNNDDNNDDGSKQTIATHILFNLRLQNI